MAGIPISCPRKPSLLGEFFEDAMNQLALNQGSSKIQYALDQMNRSQRDAIRERPSQDDCKHLKGNGNKGNGPGISYPRLDYAVWHHVFPDSTQLIACAICGKRWHEEDPDWTTAVAMLKESTNTTTASEIAVERWRIKLPKYAFFKSEQEAQIWFDEQKSLGRFEVLSSMKPRAVFFDKLEKN